MRVHLNGIDVFYSSSGAGQPIVLIHGYPLDHTIWDPQRESTSHKTTSCLHQTSEDTESRSQAQDHTRWTSLLETYTHSLIIFTWNLLCSEACQWAATSP